MFLWVIMFLTDLDTHGLLLRKIEIDFLGITKSSHKFIYAEIVSVSSFKLDQTSLNKSQSV